MHWYPKRWPLIRVEVAELSMLPALRPGDWLLALRTRRIRPGQVVLAWHPARADLLLVKRAARRVEGGWWLESDNPAAGAVDSGRFGPVPEETDRRPGTGPLLAAPPLPLSERARGDCVGPALREGAGPTVCRCNGVTGRT